jgi:sterol desaturase/sphingolipid hydroxylase (fatty acid hydroxylase superfamily)
MSRDPVKEKTQRLRTAFVITLILLLLITAGTWLLINLWGTQLGWSTPFVVLLAFLVWGILVDVVYWWYRRDHTKS